MPNLHSRSRSQRARDLEIRLHDWAEWCFWLNGYPSQTVEARAGEGDRETCSRSSIPKGVQASRYVTETNEAVKALKDFHPELRLAIEVRYSLVGDGLPKTQQQQYIDFKDKTGKGSRAYTEWLGKAHAWLDARLL